MNMLIKLVTEFIGTFLFLSVVILTGEAIPIALALGAMIYFGGKISTAHYNPAVSLMLFTRGDIDLVTLIGYVCAQLLGGLCAFVWYNYAYGGKRVKA